MADTQRENVALFAVLSSLADNKQAIGRCYAYWCNGAPALEAAVPFFALDPPLARCPGGLGRSTRDGGNCSLADQIQQPLPGVIAIAFLGAVALGGDNEHAIPGEPPAR